MQPATWSDILYDSWCHSSHTCLSRSLHSHHFFLLPLNSHLSSWFSRATRPERYRSSSWYFLVRSEDDTAQADGCAPDMSGIVPSFNQWNCAKLGSIVINSVSQCSEFHSLTWLRVKAAQTFGIQSMSLMLPRFPSRHQRPRNFQCTHVYTIFEPTFLFHYFDVPTKHLAELWKIYRTSEFKMKEGGTGSWLRPWMGKMKRLNDTPFTHSSVFHKYLVFQPVRCREIHIGTM